VVRDTLSSAANDAKVARRRGRGLMDGEATGHYAGKRLVTRDLDTRSVRKPR
jgi:hypothetical protein